jgi:hypothetical protein
MYLSLKLAFEYNKSSLETANIIDQITNVYDISKIRNLVQMTQSLIKFFWDNDTCIYLCFKKKKMALVYTLIILHLNY